MDRERREAEAKNASKAAETSKEDNASKGGGLFDNAKNGADALKNSTKGNK